MKKVLLAASIASALSLFNIAQAANSGTINFTGEITDATCDVVAGDNGNVALPVKSKSLFTNAAGTQSVISGKKFNIVASNCAMGTSGKTKVQAYFNPQANIDATTGYLYNVTGTAKDVELRLSYSDGTVVDLNNNVLATSDSKYVTVGTDNSATMIFQADYVTKKDGKFNKTGTDALTAGTVVSSIEYELQYD